MAFDQPYPLSRPHRQYRYVYPAPVGSLEIGPSEVNYLLHAVGYTAIFVLGMAFGSHRTKQQLAPRRGP